MERPFPHHVPRCDRRRFLGGAAALGLGAFAGLGTRGAASPAPPPHDPGILATVARHRPLRGGPVPPDFARRLATAHAGGRYALTTRPFLLEGAEAVHRLGLGGIKLWMTTVDRAYPHHSDWGLRGDESLVELARHPWFAEVLAMPFSLVALEVQEARGPGWRKVEGHSIDPDSDFAEDERQVRDLALHLLRTHGDRDVTFLLQNWEGDWMYRGGARRAWLRRDYPERERRAAAFARWFEARQRGLDAARREAGPTRARVLHAIEVNRVLDHDEGIATLAGDVLPRVEVDLISWSCYDGLKLERRSGDAAALGLWRGLDLIRDKARTRERMADGPAVYLGEIGIPEQVVAPEAVVDIFDAAMGVVLAREVPFVFHWAIYCNERIAAAANRPAPNRAEDLRGYWLLRPDGSESHAMGYFRGLLGLRAPGPILPTPEAAETTGRG